MIHVAFIMEQHLGHRTYYQNLRNFFDHAPEIRATWIEVNYEQRGHILERLPFLPAKMRGSLIGRSQVLQGLRQDHYDVALYNTQIPAVLGGGLVRKKPYLLCTDITPIQYDRMGASYGHQPDREGIASKYKHRVNTHVFQHAAHLLPWSTWTRTSLIADYGVNERQITVMPPGVDTELWKPGETHGDRPCQVLFVGGDFFRKGGDILLEAFHRLPEGKCELIIVTRTPLDPEAGIRVYTHLAPNTPELIDLYRSCDVFVFPTKAEAFGIAAVEASAAGLPVIATRMGGLQDIVVDEETGFFIEAGDVEGLVRNLGYLVENRELRIQMGMAGRRYAQLHFDYKINAGQILDLFKDKVKPSSQRD